MLAASTLAGGIALSHQEAIAAPVDNNSFIQQKVTMSGLIKGKIVNVTTNLRVRSGASTNSSVIGYLSNSTDINIVAQEGSWYKISYNGSYGYVSKDYVQSTILQTPAPTATTTSTTSTNGSVVNISTNLRVRSAANTSSGILGYLLNGEKVTITGESGSWYQIKYNNSTAYVSKDYIKKDSAQAVVPTPMTTTTATTASTTAASSSGKVVNVTTTLRVRSGASTSSSVVGSLRNGQAVTITGENGDWYQIDYSNSKAYVAKAYVQKTTSTTTTTPTSTTTPTPIATKPQTSTSQKGQVINISSNLRVRVAANTSCSVLGYLTNGQVVDIIGKTSDWYKISFNGKEGYVCDEYIKIVDSSTTTTPTPTNSTQTSSTYNTILNAMKANLGSPYVWGGSGESLTTALLNRLRAIYPYQASQGAYTRAAGYADKGYKAFDCSGLMQWGYRQAGISIGRTTWDQINNGVEVPLNQVKPGDLLFNKSLGHVGMYLGNGQWIEAPNKSANVRITSVPWSSIGRARRIIK